MENIYGITLDSFKGPSRTAVIMAQELEPATDECYEAVPEAAIAAIASQFCISNESALNMLIDSIGNDDIICESKNARFWVEFE